MLRIIGMLSAICLTLLFSNTTDELLLSRDLNLYNVVSPQQDQAKRLSLGLEAKPHNNPLHTVFCRYLYKPTERQNLPTYFLPTSDSVYANVNLLSSLRYRELDGEIYPRVRRDYESNLIYRFIHSRNAIPLFSA